MAEEYTYTLAQCDVPIERHSVLQSYRDKRRLWLSWISTECTTPPIRTPRPIIACRARAAADA